jgi:hypothetical protein
MPAVHSVPAAVARPLQVAPIEFLPALHSIRTYTVSVPDGLATGVKSSVRR